MKKIGVLGYGSIGKRHAENLKKLDCDVAVYDPALASSWVRDYVIKWADAVVIASPTDQHWTDISDCDELNKPVFVEKPICGANLRNTLIKNVIMVGYNLRFHSCVKKARQWLGEDMIGRPIWANFTCAQFNDKPAYLRDGVILNWSHEIDLALYLLGPANVASCTTAQMNGAHEVLADITLQHKHGCQITIHLDYVTKPENRTFRITGERGYIYVDIPARFAVCCINDGPRGVPDLTTFNGRDSFDENYVDEMKAFLGALDGKGSMGCTAQEAIDVLDICLKAKEMAR